MEVPLTHAHRLTLCGRIHGIVLKGCTKYEHTGVKELRPWRVDCECESVGSDGREQWMRIKRCFSLRGS